MKILSCVIKGYYGRRDTVEPMYIAFTEPLRALGHEVDHFDHYLSGRNDGPAVTAERLVEKVRRGGYDAVLYQTACQEARYVGESIREAGRYAPTIAWNSAAGRRISTSPSPASFTATAPVPAAIWREKPACRPMASCPAWCAGRRFFTGRGSGS